MDRVEIFIFYNFSLIKETASPYSYIHARLPVKMSGMELIFEEEGYLVKTLSTHEEVEAGLRLRHEVFSRELRWVPESPDGMERDPYDDFSRYIGVFDARQNITGHARLIAFPDPFMVDKEFACLMPKDKNMRKATDLAEITRLCIRKEERASGGYLNISQLLYKGIYNWSLSCGIRHMIMVVDYRYFRLLKLNGFPVEAIGDFVTMPDGVRAGAVSLDWRSFEAAAAKRRPEFLEWISKLPAHYPSRALSHGLY